MLLVNAGSIGCVELRSAISNIEMKEELISVPDMITIGNTNKKRALPSVRK